MNLLRKQIQTPSPSPMLVPLERIMAGLFGFVIFGWSAYVLFAPPEHKEVISGCKTTGKACTVTVSSVPQAMTSLLVAAGVALLLVAFLGVRFRSIKLPGVELASVQDSSPAQAQAAREHKTVPLSVGTAQDQPSDTERVALWSSLPSAVQNSIIDKWQAEDQTDAPWKQLTQVDRPRSGSNEWFVHFGDRVWRAVTTTPDRQA